MAAVSEKKISVTTSPGWHLGVPKFRLLVPNQLHPTLLTNSLVRVIVVSVIRGEIDISIVVRSGTCSESAPLEWLLQPIEPLLLLLLFLH